MRKVYPGHGAPFGDFKAAVSRSMRRIERYFRNHELVGWDLLKKLMVYTLLMKQVMEEEAFFRYLVNTWWFKETIDFYFKGAYEKKCREIMDNLATKDIIRRGKRPFVHNRETLMPGCRDDVAAGHPVSRRPGIAEANKTMRTNLKAVLAGIVAYAAIFGLKYGFETFFLSPESTRTGGIYLFLASTLMTLLLLVAPAYLAGWIARDRGTLLGLIVAVAGYSLRYLLLSAKWHLPLFDMASVIIRIEQLLMPATLGAISGAAGQLHKLIFQKRL